MEKTIEFKDCGLAVKLIVDENGICTDAIDISDHKDLTFRKMISAYVGYPIIVVFLTIQTVIPLYISVKKREESLYLMRN